MSELEKEFSYHLPRVLVRERVRDGSLSVARVIKDAIDLIDVGEFPGVPEDDIWVIRGNLEILLKAVY